MLFVSRLENKEPFFVVGLPELTRRGHARSLVHPVAIGDDDDAVSDADVAIWVPLTWLQTWDGHWTC